MRTEFWWGILREGDHLEDPHVDDQIILKLLFEERDGGVRTGSILIKIGTGGVIL